MYGTAGGGGGYRDDAYAGSQAEPLTGGGARRRQVRTGTLCVGMAFRRIGCQFPSAVTRLRCSSALYLSCSTNATFSSCMPWFQLPTFSRRPSKTETARCITTRSPLRHRSSAATVHSTLSRPAATARSLPARPLTTAPWTAPTMPRTPRAGSCTIGCTPRSPPASESAAARGTR